MQNSHTAKAVFAFFLFFCVVLLHIAIDDTAQQKILLEPLRGIRYATDDVIAKGKNR